MINPKFLTVGLSLFFTLQACVPRKYNDHNASQTAKFKFVNEPLEVEEVFRLPIKELSGLSWFCGHKKQNLFLGVGDKSNKLGLSDSAESADLDVKQGLTKLDSRFVSDKGAQFEALACDKTSLFLLSESLSSIAVLELDSFAPKAVLELDVSTIPAVAELWQNASAQTSEDSNSNGEGMILLKTGHLLIAKEKNPPLLLEFAPAAEKAPAISGFANLQAVDENDLFPLPKSSKGPFNRRYILIKRWELGDDSSQASQDISELAVGPNGRLFVLSDQSRTFAEVKADDSQKLKYERAWMLPSEIHKAEGLIFDKAGHAYVGVDGAKGGSPNVFKLSPISF